MTVTIPHPAKPGLGTQSPNISAGAKHVSKSHCWNAFACLDQPMAARIVPRPIGCGCAVHLTSQRDNKMIKLALGYKIWNR